MDLIEQLSQFGIIVCKKCQIGVLPNSQWNSHFRKHQVAHSVRQGMRECMLEDPQIIRDEQQLEEKFEYPVGEVSLPQLPVYRDGLRCEMAGEGEEQCRFVCRSPTHIKAHCRTQHGWINRQGRGGSMRQRQSVQRPWREGVHCQRLFYSGPRCGYFEVQAVEPGITEGDRGGRVERLYEKIRRK
jgi:hypothetical protein